MVLSRRQAVTGMLGLGAAAVGLGAAASSAAAVPPGVRPSSADWAALRRDAGRSSWNPAERAITADTVTALAPQWSIALSSGQSTSPAIRVDDRLLHVVTSDRRWLFARSAETGAVQWRVTTTVGGPGVDRVQADRRVVAMGSTGTTYAGPVRIHDIHTGATLWSLRARDFALHAGTLYVLSEVWPVFVIAYDALTGTERWRVNLTAGSSRCPLVANDYGVLTATKSERGEVQRAGFTPTGEWRTHRGTEEETIPVLEADDVIFADRRWSGGAYEEYLDLIDLGGSSSWRRPLHGKYPRANVQAAGAAGVVVTDGRGRIRLRDRLTGESRWRTDTTYAAADAPIVAGSLLYAPNGSGRVHVRSMETGELVTRIDPADGAPLDVQPDGLFVSRGRLFAVGPTTLSSYGL